MGFERCGGEEGDSFAGVTASYGRSAEERGRGEREARAVVFGGVVFFFFLVDGAAELDFFRLVRGVEGDALRDAVVELDAALFGRCGRMGP